MTELFDSSEEIYDLINTIPALFWKIEIVKNKIEYLNNFMLPGLEEKSKLLLQNMDFSRDTIIEEDFHIFESFMKALKDKKSKFAIFRIKLANGTIRWIKISGHPDSKKSTYYMGYILEITDVVNHLRNVTSNGFGIKDKISIFDNPILLVKFSDRKIYAANNASLKIFGYTDEEIQNLKLSDLFKDIIENHFQRIYEEILFHDRWNGKLIFYNNIGNPFKGEIAIRSLNDNGENLLWISIYDISDENQIIKKEIPSSLIKPEINMNDTIIKEVNKKAKRGDIIKVLELFLNHQPINNLADSILYSDVYIDKGKVVTYGVGPSFEFLPLGEEYPYEGTIAENIVKYDLKYIIVEDTYKSIKPIDWALFIPHNVKSYYAIPFYEKENLKTVLIYCSKNCSIFTEENITLYTPQFSVFQNALMLWQKTKK